MPDWTVLDLGLEEDIPKSSNRYLNDLEVLTFPPVFGVQFRNYLAIKQTKIAPRRRLQDLIQPVFEPGLALSHKQARLALPGGLAAQNERVRYESMSWRILSQMPGSVLERLENQLLHRFPAQIAPNS